MPGLLGKPKPYTERGLLTPVMWDRVRRQQGLLGTEGEGRVVGGYTPRSGELPMSGGGMRKSAPPKYDWKMNDYGYWEVTLPQSKVRMSAEPRPSYREDGRQDLNIIFSWPNYAEMQASGVGIRGSTKRGVGTLSEVFSSLSDIKRKVNPGRITWSAASDKHKKVYDRMAPKMSEIFGGALSRPSPKHYVITLP